MATCATCEKPIEPNPGRGQPRRYCSNACKQKAYREARKEWKRRTLGKRPPHK
jgi:endogenous inhibitor of DNA gyrase (YacG/DUF329 family)